MIGSDNGVCFVEMRMISGFIYSTNNFEDNLETLSQKDVIIKIKFYIQIFMPGQNLHWIKMFVHKMPLMDQETLKLITAVLGSLLLTLKDVDVNGK